MSARAFFDELEAVATVLDEYVVRQDDKTDYFKRLTEEEFTAVWQAVELLSRAYTVLLPYAQVQQAQALLDRSKGYLDVPDVVVTEE